MDLKTLFRTASAALVVGGAAVALVACGGASSGDIPTAVWSSASEGGTLSASDLTTSDGAGATETSPEGRPQGPPEEALAACDGLAAETACSFASPLDGSAIDGTCRARRDDPSQYVCFPDDWDGRGGPGHGHQGPSEESLAACEGVETGAACSFEAPFGTVEGTCSQGPGDANQAACRPEWAEGEGPFGPQGGHGQGHEEAQAACDSLQTDAACSFEGPFGTVSGNCRTSRDGATLVCAPASWPGH